MGEAVGSSTETQKAAENKTEPLLPVIQKKGGKVNLKGAWGQQRVRPKAFSLKRGVKQEQQLANAPQPVVRHNSRPPFQYMFSFSLLLSLGGAHQRRNRRFAATSGTYRSAGRGKSAASGKS